MGQSKKNERAKEAFLLVCQQYSHIGLYMRAEVEAMKRNDPAATHAAREFLAGQYQELGEQLKVLGMAIDSFGGPPVLQPAPGNNGGH